jgi:acyl-coenzyme A thioesterase PaaI-like protein
MLATMIDGDQRTRQHMLRELGFAVRTVGDELHGSAEIIPEMSVPGTSRMRTSILAMWVDTLAGLLAATAMSPRVPVTLELDVQLYHPAPVEGRVLGVGRTVKKGRSVFVARVEFTSADGQPIAMAAGSFMLAPDPTVRLPAQLSIDVPPSDALLTVPLAERAGCERREPGVAVLPRSEDGLNSSRTVNGGLIALVAEEAALSLTPGETLCSLALRYLQPVRFGPVVAAAVVIDGLGRVELRDAGNADRLSVLATTRTFGR